MTKENNNISMEEIVSLCKRRGFIFPACEIYGGFANSYSYGPYGSQLKNNIKALWWKKFVEDRKDMVGIDGPILLNPKLWEASGHTGGFNAALVDCKECKRRFRADHLVEKATGEDMEGRNKDMTRALQAKKVPCPVCKKFNWTEVRDFNEMFSTNMNGITDENGDYLPVYLRPETAGAIFMDYKNILDSTRVKIPFGVAQIGKAFRNEIVAGNFTFRIREFEQMEIEYFIHPDTKWEQQFENWLVEQNNFAQEIGISKDLLSRYEHPKEKLSHYSKKTTDTMFKFPFGIEELFGMAHRSDFDLSSHAKHSGKDLSYDDRNTGERYIPHVLEPTFGLDRAILATIISSFVQEDLGEGESRIVMKFPPKIAPVKIAIFPLLKNKLELVKKAEEAYDNLKNKWLCEFDDNGNIGKRYRRQDEIGTPFCVTIDFETIEKDNSVTVRDRDTMKQERVKLNQINEYFEQKFN
ncbi:glycine--tRNA ligase [Patescibacteria group bacterium]|nr:glycine--tRNA ligase [Patescibacteria group bacterium]